MLPPSQVKRGNVSSTVRFTASSPTWRMAATVMPGDAKARHAVAASGKWNGQSTASAAAGVRPASRSSPSTTPGVDSGGRGDGGGAGGRTAMAAMV
jgi:hypothetical protein